MNIIKLHALKLYLEKLEKEYCHKLSTMDIEIYGDYYHQKLKEVRQNLWQVNQCLDNLRTCEKNRSHLSKCWSKDSSLGHPHPSESGL